MLADQSVLDRARKALARELSIDPDTIADDSLLDEDLGIDSLDRLQLVFAMEQEFNVVIPTTDFPEDQRFRAVVEHMLASVGASPGDSGSP